MLFGVLDRSLDSKNFSVDVSEVNLHQMYASLVNTYALM